MADVSGGSAGFTLLELLVAMALLGLLTMVMFGSMRFGVQAWARTDGTLTRANEIRRVETSLAKELTQAFPLFESSDNSGQIAFEGEAHRLSYLTPSDVAGALKHVDIMTSDQDDRLTLFSQEHLELSRDGKETSTALLKDLRTVEFSYFGISSDQKEPQWSAEWKHQSKLPTLIRLRLQLRDSSWREQMIAPRLSADVGCAFDPLTKSCRGR